MNSDEREQAPGRLWIAPTTLKNRDGRIYIAPGRKDNEVEYVRADLAGTSELCYPEPDGDFNRSWHTWKQGRCATCGAIDAATRMREACVEKVKRVSYYHDSRCLCVTTVHGPCDCGAKARFDKLVGELQSVTLEAAANSAPGTEGEGVADDGNSFW